MEYTKTIKRKQVCEENVFYNKRNGTNRRVQHNALTLGHRCNFALPKEDCNATTPGTKHWQETSPASQDSSPPRFSLAIADITLSHHSLAQKMP